MVLSRLRVDHFDSVSILNFDLLCYLLQTRPTNDEYLVKFLQLLKRTRNLRFIREFIDKKGWISEFIEATNHVWPSIFTCILSESGFSKEFIKQYAVFSLYYSSDDDIIALNKDNGLKSFVISDSGFLNIENPQIDRLIQKLYLIDARFKRLDHKVSNKELFIAVYRNNLYMLTFENISLILEVIYGFEKSNDFNSRNYTLITTKPNEALVQYVNDNINEYMDVLLDNCFDFINDEERAALAILNNPEIDINHKERYIGYLKTEIGRIDDVK